MFGAIAKSNEESSLGMIKHYISLQYTYAVCFSHGNFFRHKDATEAETSCMCIVDPYKQ